MKFTRYLLILIAAVCMAADPSPKKSGKKADTPAAAAQQNKAGALVDINSASEKELKELPGIGDAYSSKIIAGRPYRAKNQLVQKNIIPQATYEKIKDMIIAKQSGAAKQAGAGKK